MNRLWAWIRRQSSVIGYLILVVGIVLALQQVLAIGRREVASCADPRGDAALRHQWERVLDIYQRVQDKRVTTEQARLAFVNTYSQALQEAGSPPACLEGGP